VHWYSLAGNGVWSVACGEGSDELTLRVTPRRQAGD
jgi:hypothetical protein